VVVVVLAALTHKTGFLVALAEVVLLIAEELVQEAQETHLQQAQVKEMPALITPSLMLVEAAALVRLALVQTVVLEQHHQLQDHL
jgi:hypothetical protein